MTLAGAGSQTGDAPDATTVAASGAGPDQLDDRGREALQRVALARLTASGVDLEAARRTFTERRGRRRLTQRALGASTAVMLLLVTGLVIVPGGGSDPDAVLADREESVASTTVSSTAAPAADVQIMAPPETVAVVTTLSIPPTSAAPVPTAPPATLAPNQALTASLQVLTPTVEAGQSAGVSVAWSDPDLGGNIPRNIVSWGDPLLSTPVDTSDRAACDTPGAPASGTDELRFRYSTPGAYVVRVVVDTCDGRGAYAGRVDLDGTIIVTAPRFVDPTAPGSSQAAGRAVVVFQPPLADRSAWPALGRATAEYLPAAAPQSPVALTTVDPTPVFTTSGPATVLVVPDGAVGALRLRWNDPTSCATTSGAPLVGADGAVVSLPLSLLAC